MATSLDWRLYVNEYGDFELPEYLFKCINDLMKQSLDMGTLLCSDPKKLRAFKETTKKNFKQRWLDVAKALEFFDIVVPCGCAHDEYCEVCSGSRYRLNVALSPDRMREVAVIFGAESDAEMADMLQKGLRKAIKEARELGIEVE